MKLAKVGTKIIGEKLASPIYNRSGMVLLSINSEITQGNIAKLQQLNINRVYIKDLSSDVLFIETLPADIRFKVLKQLTDLFECIKNNIKVDLYKIYGMADEIIQYTDVSENAFLYDNVGKTNTIFDLCQHSVNVATLSVLIGKKKKYSQSQLRNLCAGALLHDIGKIFVQDESHVLKGLQICRQSTAFGSTTLSCVRHHHERFDGKGYPDKIKGEKIYEFARIVSMCDEYINLYMSEHLLPTEALEIIAAKTGTIFDQEIYKEFVNSIYCYPNGLSVKLNTGQTAIVFMQNVNFPSRPVVCVYENGYPEHVYDLMKELTIFIEDVMM